MVSERKYHTSLTGASFLFQELKQVIQLKQEGLSDKEVRKKVYEENIFQYKYPSSIKRVFPSVLRRANVLDESLCLMMVNETIDIGKVVNLFAIMKTDQLFFEFMDEVIREKLTVSDFVLEKKDMNRFFTYKMEQSEKIAGWTELTVEKLKQIYLKVLMETKVLKDAKTGELNHLLVDGRVKEHLLRNGEKQYVKVMGD